MVVSNALWKILLDKNLHKKNLTEQLNISSTIVVTVEKGEQIW